MIDFLKYRSVYATFSALFFLSFIGGYWYKLTTSPDHQAFVYSVEFTGGLEVLYSFSKPVSGDKVKEIFENHGISGVVVRTFTNSADVIVRVPLRSIGMDGVRVTRHSGARHRSRVLPRSTLTVEVGNQVGNQVGNSRFGWREPNPYSLGRQNCLLTL